MRPNNLLTTLLYVLLVGLIVMAIYKGCEMKRDQERKRLEDAELQQTLRDMGYVDEDTTQEGSNYAGEIDLSGSSASQPSANDGIEDEPAPASRPTATPPRTATTKGRAPSDLTPSSTAGVEGETPVNAPTPAETRPRNLDTDTGGARYRVQAGSFTKMEGARRRLEEVIKLGYQSAEIGKTNAGRYAVVVVKRTNSRSEADQIADRLRARGIEARVVAQ
jgi:cell division protein FtsN